MIHGQGCDRSPSLSVRLVHDPCPFAFAMYRVHTGAICSVNESEQSCFMFEGVLSLDRMACVQSINHSRTAKRNSSSRLSWPQRKKLDRYSYELRHFLSLSNLTLLSTSGRYYNLFRSVNRPTESVRKVLPLYIL